MSALGEMREPIGGPNIVRWSIEHPYMVISFYLGVVILAVLAIGFYMPRRMMPYVESPMIGVVTMMPGLSAQETELYISKPIEESLVNIKGLRYLRSTSQDGFSIVTLEFPYGTNMQKALFDVQALMNVIQANLPMTGANLKPSWVLPIDPLNIPILSFALTAEGWEPARLREFADNEVVNRLKAVPNVYSVVPFGGYRRQLQVLVDRDKLAAYGLSIVDVRHAIDRQNVSRPGGTITSGANEAIVRLDSRARDAETVANYPILVTGVGPEAQMNGASASMLRHRGAVYIRDVAQVADTHWERRSGYHFYDRGQVKPALEVSVIQDPWASSARVVPAVRKVVRELQRENPGIHFEVAYDNAHFVGILFRNMFEELGLAIILTGLAVLLFLGEWRGTLISMTTIPISLAMAILCLIPMKMSLNSSTLIGLLLCIGRLVDDSIIDIHAVERHMRLGKDPKTATIDGITEVRRAVIASTLMLCLALSPLLACGGIVQLMFVGLVWPLIFGLLSSMLVSFTLTAVMAANILKPHEQLAAERSSWPYRRILNPFQAALDRLENGYRRLIGWLLLHRFSNMARILCTIVIGFGFYHFIGSEMMPLADVGQAYAIVETQPGTSFEGTERVVRALEQIMAKHPEIEKGSVEIGAETMFESFSPFYTGYAMPQVNAATMMLTLSDKDARERSIWQAIDALQAEALATIPGIRRLQIKEMGADVMATAQAPVALILYGKDLHLLSEMGRQALAAAQQTPGMHQPATSWVMGVPDYEIEVDAARAREIGLTPDEISQQAYYALRGGLASEFYRLPNIRQNTVLIRYASEQHRTPEDIESLYLTGGRGQQVPLKSTAQVRLRQAPTLVEHDGLRRVVSLLGFYRRGGPPSMDLSMDLMGRVTQKVNFPPGYGLEMRGDMTQMMDSFRRLLLGLGVALLFMFLVLVAQFRGFLQPLQMVFSLPLELSGIFFLLWLNQQAFSSVSVMAVIIVSGMDLTAAILLIDLILQYRHRGMPRSEAVLRACPERLRPILMTSIITIIVMLPVAFFPKTGIDAYSPLGTVVIGGLLVGTVLSLLDIPIMHTYVDDLAVWVNRRLLKRRGAEAARR